LKEQYVVFLLKEVVLSDEEIRIINSLKKLRGRAELRKLSEISGFDVSKLNAIGAILKAKGLIKEMREVHVILRASPELIEYAQDKTPERALLEAVYKHGELALNELQEVLPEKYRDRINIAVAWARRKGWIEIISKDGVRVLKVSGKGLRYVDKLDMDEKLMKIIVNRGVARVEDIPEELKGYIKILVKRGLVEKDEEKVIFFELTELGRNVAEGKYRIICEVTRLTRDIIVSGEWRRIRIKKYDVTARPPVIYPGKKHPYLEFLEEVRRILIGMGFEEVQGPLVELEFWNFDALFQAQDHPAREIHDSYILKHPREALLEENEYVKRIRDTHEKGWITGSKGWGYKWDFSIARRLILRSQTTAVSVRTLYRRNRPPLKVFTIDKVFRPETLDSKHSMEFHQVEGIVLAEGLNLKHLLGYLKQFALELGFKKIKFKPAYFPFTEPSVEAYVYHPKLGWIEILGAGLFRPEVLVPLGIDYPRVQCLAWGIGIGRLAMIRLGIDDIRYLHSQDLNWLRNHSYKIFG